MLAFMIVLFVLGAIAVAFTIAFIVSDSEITPPSIVTGIFALVFIVGGVTAAITGPQQYEKTLHIIETLVPEEENFVVGKSAGTTKNGYPQEYYWIKYADNPEPQTLKYYKDIVFTDDVVPSLVQTKKAWDFDEKTILYLPTNTVFKVF